MPLPVSLTINFRFSYSFWYRTTYFLSVSCIGCWSSLVLSPCATLPRTSHLSTSFLVSFCIAIAFILAVLEQIRVKRGSTLLLRGRKDSSNQHLLARKYLKDHQILLRDIKNHICRASDVDIWVLIFIIVHSLLHNLIGIFKLFVVHYTYQLYQHIKITRNIKPSWFLGEVWTPPSMPGRDLTHRLPR